MSDFSLTLVLQIKTSKIINDMAKVQQKFEKIVDQGTLFESVALQSLIYCYSLNNPVTDARYSGQLPESSSLIA